ncbi:hypothetical protein tb265_45570 [Gemmatimonadetes bacterium T265]|nr:hypothetical protein tb265_45570 [Gemmatimonadetes bacterium T265]
MRTSAATLGRVADALQLAAADRAYVAEVCTRCPALAEARALAHGFRRMLREHDRAAFLPWLAAAHRSVLEPFVRGLRYDVEAVYAGVALPWCQGQVEGQVHRLKLLKRSMYRTGELRPAQAAHARRGVSGPPGVAPLKRTPR